MESIPSDAQITAEIAYDALDYAHRPTPLALIAELRRLADHIWRMDSGSGEVELLRTTIARLELLQANPSTLEVTKIKQKFSLYDERQIYDTCRFLIEIRNSILLPAVNQRKLKDESR
jgi:hypothetical protein